MHPHQAAYKSGKSTEDILRVAVDIISNSIDSGEAVCVAFLDLQEAFDSLDHMYFCFKDFLSWVCQVVHWVVLKTI